MGSHFIYIKGLTKALKIAGHWDELQKKNCLQRNCGQNS